MIFYHCIKNQIKLNYGFSNKIVEAVKLLTYNKDVPYMDYVAKIKDNELARKVKIADLTHNSDLSRLKEITDKDKKRYNKYQNALLYLT